MKFTWKGRWREGEITVEAQTAKELEDVLRELQSIAELNEVSGESKQEFPEIPAMLGCTGAVRLLMEKDWGKQPRAMNEIKKALELNELYFSKEALAATLATMAKKGDVRRMKENGKWRYFAK